MGTDKAYYNDQHQKKEVTKHREECIATLHWLHKRIRVWIVQSREEKNKHLEMRGMSSLPEAMSVGEVVVIDNIPKYVHHMDDQGG